MDTAQKIRLIRMIEKIEKNPEFSSKIGVRNTRAQIKFQVLKQQIKELHWLNILEMKQRL